MTSTRTRARTAWLAVARAGTAMCGSMLLLTVISAARGTDPSALAAATSRGAVTFSTGAGPATSGGSANFTMLLPSGAACAGGGPAGYKWETFLLSGSIDIGALTWGANGPNPVTGALVTSMYSADSEQVTSRFPGTNPLGIISGIPQLSLANTVSSLPVGTYRIGIACTFGGATQDYWSSNLAVTANTGDTPLGITWTVSAAPTTTTTTTTTTTAATTTTTAATTTTVKPTTTTTVAGATTTVAATTTAAPTTTSSVASGGAGINTGSGAGSIPATGTSSSVPLVVWGFLTLVFGRMVVLLARPIRVVPVDRR
jgi:hypothetical protein